MKINTTLCVLLILGQQGYMQRRWFPEWDFSVSNTMSIQTGS